MGGCVTFAGGRPIDGSGKPIGGSGNPIDGNGIGGGAIDGGANCAPATAGNAATMIDARTRRISSSLYSRVRELR